MNIAILDDYQNVARDFAAWDRLPAGCAVTVFNDTIADQDALAARLRPFDIVCVMRERTPLDAAMIARLDQLKLIVTTGGRNASIDLDAAKARGITVSGTGSRANGTVELTIAFLVGLKRGVFAAHDALHAHGWQTEVGGDVDGATLGILGLGRLGREVARIAQALGMRVMAWSPNLTPARAGEVGVTAATLDQVLAESDVVTIHMRLSDMTRGLIGAGELGLMRPDAYLINTARGPIVETAALIDACANGRIAGAALDVFDEEPLRADHPLRTAKNIYLTPHIGFVTQANYRDFYEGTLAAVEGFIKGAPVGVIG